MVEQGIIKPVDEALEWCHPIVIVPKKGTDKIRLTIDLTKINRQVERPVHPMSVPKEVIGDIKDAEFFTALDTRYGYWQVPLDKDSRHLTTFMTPWGGTDA